MRRHSQSHRKIDHQIFHPCILQIPRLSFVQQSWRDRFTQDRNTWKESDELAAPVLCRLPTSTFVGLPRHNSSNFASYSNEESLLIDIPYVIRGDAVIFQGFEELR